MNTALSMPLENTELQKSIFILWEYLQLCKQEREIPYDVPFLWNQKDMIYFTYKTEIDSQSKKNKLVYQEGKG